MKICSTEFKNNYQEKRLYILKLNMAVWILHYAVCSIVVNVVAQ